MYFCLFILLIEDQIYITRRGLSQDKKIPIFKKISFNMSTLPIDIEGLMKNNTTSWA